MSTKSRGCAGEGQGLTQRQLDEKCENYLKSSFGEAVDFALENSLPLLLEDGLINKDAQVSHHDSPIEKPKI